MLSEQFKRDELTPSKTTMSVPNKSSIMACSSPVSDEIGALVSTVITSYNKAPYLAEAIISALAQDYSHQEILVIDDGSTDHTPEIALAFRDQIRYIRQENRGPSGAKNRGILEVRGEFIAFLDGDDCWRPGKLTKQIECFRRNPAVALVYTDRLVLREAQSSARRSTPTGGTFTGAGFLTNF